MWLTRKSLQITSILVLSSNQRFKEAFIPFARFTRDQFRARQLPWDISTVSSVCKTKSGRGEGRESVASVTPVGPEKTEICWHLSKSSLLALFELIWVFLRCWQYTLVLIYWWFTAPTALCTNPSRPSIPPRGKLDLRPRQVNSYCVRSISFSFITSCLCFSWNSFAASSCNRTAQDALVPEGNTDFVMRGKCLFPLIHPLKQVSAGSE